MAAFEAEPKEQLDKNHGGFLRLIDKKDVVIL